MYIIPKFWVINENYMTVYFYFTLLNFMLSYGQHLFIKKTLCFIDDK